MTSAQDDVYIQLATHSLIKKALDDYLNPEQRRLDKRDILFDYCNTYGKIPPQRGSPDNIGCWFQDQKKKITSIHTDEYTIGHILSSKLSWTII